MLLVKVTKNILLHRTLVFFLPGFLHWVFSTRVLTLGFCQLRENAKFRCCKNNYFFKNPKTVLLLKFWKLTLLKHSKFRCCKNNLKVKKKNFSLNRTFCFVVSIYVRMQNFVVAKLIVVFKNPKNSVITKIRESYLLSLCGTK